MRNREQYELMLESISRIEAEQENEYFRPRYEYILDTERLPLEETTVFVEAQGGLSCNGAVFQLLKQLAKEECFAHFSVYLSVHARLVKRWKKLLEAYGLTKIQLVVLSSEKYFKLLATAKYLIIGKNIQTWWVKREGQILLHLVKESKYKKKGRFSGEDVFAIGMFQRTVCNADYVVFPNEEMKERLVKDYMVEHLLQGKYLVLEDLVSVLPETEADKQRKQMYAPNGEKLYAYLPTLRGRTETAMMAKSEAMFAYYLYELDKLLSENELLYVSFYPLYDKILDFSELKRIRPFPDEVETCDFLAMTDALITDYSGVIGEYEKTGKKVVLFSFDEEEFGRRQGLHSSYDALTHQRAGNLEELLKALRDTDSAADGVKGSCAENAANALLRTVLLGENAGLLVYDFPKKTKENVLFYAGNFAKNGITTAALNYLKEADKTKYHYHVVLLTDVVKENPEIANMIPQDVSFYVMSGYWNLTKEEAIQREKFSGGELMTKKYMKLHEKRFAGEWVRRFGAARFDRVVNFDGYGKNITLFLSTFPGKKLVFVHNNMQKELAAKSDLRRDVLEYAYRAYDKVVLVSEEQREPTAKLAGTEEKLVVCPNLIDRETVLKRSEEAFALGKETKVFPDRERCMKQLASGKKKFITIGRYSAEKGHFRLLEAFCEFLKKEPESVLFIMGGNSRDGYYEKTVEKVKELNLENNVVLLLNQPNPYPLVKQCDYFILSSFYEGLPVVITEADILGKPVVSTDIPGPHNFLQKFGGTLVENSAEGVYHGLELLAAGKVPLLKIDYAGYNKAALNTFEELLK